jgi:choline dehydrogenase
MSEREYDYVIIGGGTAGCILATRLTEDPAVRVLMLEAGSRGRSWKVRMPSAYDFLFKNPQFNWCYQGEPESHLNGRRMYQPRGKVLGGSSGINGLGFIRGHPLDFERWVRQGAAGWSYREVLPYFRRSETWDGGADLYRGGDGPVRVTTGTCEEPLYRAFLEAGRQAGFASSKDLNGAAPEGFGAFQTNIDRGIRASTAHAYLRLARGRGNLKIETAARAHRILVEGNHAVGVAYACEGEGREARASREVILCGGSFNSPQMLMLSGIGPADDLKGLDIKVAVDLPGVGQNLQDHAAAYMQYECPEPVSVTKYLRADRKLMMGMQWFLFQKGPAAGNNLETMALLRSDPSVPQPDIEIQNLAVVFDHDGGIDQGMHGFTYCIGPTRAEGSGWVKLRSANPDDPPRILCNFLSTPADWHLMRESIRIGREVAYQKAYDRYRSREISPGPAVKTDAEIDEYLRGATVNDFHPTGTCRMGSDRMAVVDSTLKVHGIEGLRVVDASVMPSTVSANTNATTIMIGEKAADLVRGRPPLPPAVVPLPGGEARAEVRSA